MSKYWANTSTEHRYIYYSEGGHTLALSLPYENHAFSRVRVRGGVQEREEAKWGKGWVWLVEEGFSNQTEV